MDKRPQPDLLRWYTVFWVLVGPIPPAIAVWDQPPATKYVSLVLLAVVSVSFALARRFTALHLGTLVAVLGAMSYELNGGAPFFVISLPQFWILAPSPRRAIVFSGLAAIATVVGDGLRDGDALSNKAVITVVGYAASVLLGLWARRLTTELGATRRELAEAHRRQGAAEERERLAREIHDTLAQGFASIVVLAEAARTDPVGSEPKLISIERTARENLAEARALVGGSAPRPTGTIAQTLRRTLDRFTEDTGLSVDADLADLDCDQQTRIALLRCTQESLANVRKHAAATTVGIVLARHPHGIELEITDDGRGFTPSSASGFGLNGMRRRLAELGGDLVLTSSPGDGTRVLALIPTEAGP
jgi:signal transduction histidine kinase